MFRGRGKDFIFAAKAEIYLRLLDADTLKETLPRRRTADPPRLVNKNRDEIIPIKIKKQEDEITTALKRALDIRVLFYYIKFKFENHYLPPKPPSCTFLSSISTS